MARRSTSTLFWWQFTSLLSAADSLFIEEFRIFGILTLPENVNWNYVVLAAAAAFEFYSWRLSYRELCRQKDADESVFDEIVGSKDPTIFTIFLEDSAGLIGTAVAFLGIWLGRTFQNPFLDPAASILIGVLLAAVAVLLGRETGALLVGERTNRSRIDRIRRIIRNDPMSNRSVNY